MHLKKNPSNYRGKVQLKGYKVSFERYVNICPMSGWILTVREAAVEKSACVLLLGLNRKNKIEPLGKQTLLNMSEVQLGSSLHF